jgi:arylsulfatase A-like enzyme
MLSRRRFAAAASTWAVRAQPRRPNFVVLFTDDQRFDTIAALGQSGVRTPNLDRLVRRGLTFTHTHTMGGTHGAICVPSRGMLMTGRSLFRVHRDVMAQNAPETFPTIPEHLRNAGYETFATGKWHNTKRLFQRSFSASGPIFWGGMTDQFKVPVTGFDPEGRYPKAMERIEQQFASTLFADAAVDFLRRRDRKKPYLLYTAFTAPHDPRTAPERFAQMYAPDQMKLPPNFLERHPFDNGDLEVRDEKLAAFPRTVAEVQRHLADYYAMVSAVDHEIGRVLDAVDASADASNTYILFAGDNGLALGQHGLMGKQNLYDHSLRVPMIVAGPGVPQNARQSALCYIMDLAPTILDLAGLGVPPEMEARSLKGFCTGQSQEWRSHVFAAYRNFQRGVRTERWKLIEYNVNGQRTTQLFDLKRDPWEQKNLAGDALHGPNVARLRKLLAREMRRVDDPADLASAKWAPV